MALRRPVQYALMVYEECDANDTLKYSWYSKTPIFHWLDQAKQYRAAMYITADVHPPILQHAQFIKFATQVQLHYIVIPSPGYMQGIYSFAAHYGRTHNINVITSNSFELLISHYDPWRRYTAKYIYKAI